MKSPFPKSTCLGSEALNIIGRRLFPKHWTGEELDARQLPESQKAESAKRKAGRCSDGSELRSLLGFYASLDEVLAWPDPDSDKFTIEREAYIRWRAAARELDAAFRYGHVSYWVVTDAGDRIDIPAHWRERPPRIFVGALLDAGRRNLLNMGIDSAREHTRSTLDKKIAGRLYVDRSELVSALHSGGVTTRPLKQSNRGRKPIWDWEGAVAHFRTVANSRDGLPKVQADVERLVAEWFVDTHNDHPVESAIRKHVRAWCKEGLERPQNN